MPFVTINGAELHYTVEGDGPETIVFSHGLLFSGRMFDAQVAALKDRYRCITFDHRGQGRSEVTKDGYDMDSLTNDAAQLIEKLDAAPCHFAGLSMGGFVGLRLGFRKSELLRSLILIDTSADTEPRKNLGQYRLLNFIARWFGLAIVMSKVMPIMFGQTYLSDPAKAKERKIWRDRVVSGDKIGITRAVKGVIKRKSVAAEISQIKLPTLIVIGDEDVPTPAEMSDKMHTAISSSRLVTIPRAGHSSTIEQPELVTEAISDFLENISR
jgi:3-oxoadipate enol-lactonase